MRFDRERLRSVLDNLVLNAIESTVDSAAVEVIAEVSARYVTVRILDRGAGIADSERERVFDPFFTTKPKGSGIGLAICRRFVHAAGGTLELRRAPAAVPRRWLPCRRSAPAYESAGRRRRTQHPRVAAQLPDLNATRWQHDASSRFAGARRRRRGRRAHRRLLRAGRLPARCRIQPTHCFGRVSPVALDSPPATRGWQRPTDSGGAGFGGYSPERCASDHMPSSPDRCGPV